MPPQQVEVMLGRRPGSVGAPPFGHVDVDEDGRTVLQRIVRDEHMKAANAEEVVFRLYDEASSGEVLAAALDGFDQLFQPNASWSLERAVAEIRTVGLPASTLDASAVAQGHWTFYVVRARIGNADVVLLRNRSPTHGLTSVGKLMTRFVGDGLQLTRDPLVAFDERADLLVVDDKVYVLHPNAAERMLIDADAVKARAPQTAADFDARIAADLDERTVDAMANRCSRDFHEARRAEVIVREGNLAAMSADAIRAALPNAGLDANAFGSSGPLLATTPAEVRALLGIAADLYWRPRFAADPRRAGTFRVLKS